MTDDATLRNDFDQFDADKNGHIDRAEFTSLIEFLGVELNNEQISTAFLAIDIDANGRIEFGEFKAWWLKYQNA